MEEDASESVEATEITTEPMYTEEELEEYKKLFARFDADESGSIDVLELGDALRHLGCNPIDAEVDAAIAATDGKLNEIGKLEFDEFCAVMSKNRKSMEQEEEELKNAFKVFDKNGDGTIQRDELKEAIKNIVVPDVMTEEELDAVIDAADTNGNGTMEYSEIVRVILELEES